MWDQIFSICVEIMYFLGDLTGLSYNEINVLIFCAMWPLHTIYLFTLSYKARRALYLYKNPDGSPKKLPLLFPAISHLLKIKNNDN
jgi:hypothetical protein